jgi:hypothetical protein
LVEYCHLCEESGIKTEAGHFVGPKSSFPLLEDKKGRPLCDFHWWLNFEDPSHRGGMSWDEYTEKWNKPYLPKMTWPPQEARQAELDRAKSKGRR